MKSQKPLDEINIEALLDAGALQQFQDMISKMTGVAAWVFDPDGRPITQPTKFCSICGHIVQADDCGSRYCRELLSRDKQQSGNPYVGACPGGNLHYAYVPIRLQNRILATWMIGQAVGTDAERQAASCAADAQPVTRSMPDDRFHEIVGLVDAYSKQMIRHSYRAMLLSEELENIRDLNNRLIAENRFHNQVLMDTDEGIIILSSDHKHLVINPAAEKMIGWKADSLNGEIIKRIFKNRETFFRYSARNSRRFIPICIEAEDGSERQLSLRVSAMKNADGAIEGTMIHLQSIRFNQENLEQIIYISNHDALTGLFNRGYIERQMQELDEEERMPISVLMGDVNGLKFTNDVFGHYAGDHLLFLVSEAIRKNCREAHVAARWGGDEFVVLMPNTDEDAACAIAERIHGECLQYQADKLIVSISFGCATKKTGGKRMREYLIKAEDLMYKHKTTDSILFKTAMAEKIKARLLDSGYKTVNEINALEELCRRVAPCFYLSEKETEELGFLARVHDYGMIAINSYLLEKPSGLTDEEWKEIKKHSETGYRILNTVMNRPEIGELVLTHHEYWNGNGYPMGLSQKRIPWLSRIFSVIDAYTAMTSERPYRGAYSSKEAVDRLIGEKGAQFDPQAIDTFVSYIANARNP